ncbi:uncharacterized protein LOC117892758 [Drosophila subobscura]|uniref:uncharacterized protein LOC117892758 n=1 Tax=Drosophila subobscura TaxID=7241 RepID=UPI00155ADC51|nr:uncharacterized protein LOC117892758 [Drosophila subobscura]
MDQPVKRLTFGLCIFVVIGNWRIGVEGSAGCHYFSIQSEDYFDSVAVCQKFKMCLADLSTKAAFDELEDKQTDRAEYWFGLNGYEKPDLSYISSSKPKDYLPPESEISVSHSCGFLKPRPNNKYVIGTAQCGLLKRFVCTPSAMCNGVPTNSSLVQHFSKGMTCNISAETSLLLTLKP